MKEQSRFEHSNDSQRQVSLDGGRPPLDRVLEGLSRERDRYILYYLMDNEPAEFDDLASAVAAMETGESPDSISEDADENIRTQLHHTRLPKLERLGIVEYDPRSQAIRFRNPPPHFDEFLQLARQLDCD